MSIRISREFKCSNGILTLFYCLILSGQTVFHRTLQTSSTCTVFFFQFSWSDHTTMLKFIGWTDYWETLETSDITFNTNSMGDKRGGNLLILWVVWTLVAFHGEKFLSEGAKTMIWKGSRAPVKKVNNIIARKRYLCDDRKSRWNKEGFLK